MPSAGINPKYQLKQILEKSRRAGPGTQPQASVKYVDASNGRKWPRAGHVRPPPAASLRLAVYGRTASAARGDARCTAPSTSNRCRTSQARVRQPSRARPCSERAIDDFPATLTADTGHTRWVMEQDYLSSCTLPIYRSHDLPGFESRVNSRRRAASPTNSWSTASCSRRCTTSARSACTTACC